MNIRKEGYPFIGIAAGVFGIFWLTRNTVLRILGALPVLFVTWFFRDPDRITPAGDGLVISPADGTVLSVEDTVEEKLGPCRKIAIFMSVFSVHVNRAPAAGTVREVIYRPGTFHVASVGRKTRHNERMMIYLDTPQGAFRFDQVAGLIARRIVCWLSAGQQVKQGERIGLIRFGSLVECWIPKEFTATCEKGDKVFAGQSIIGRRI